MTAQQIKGQFAGQGVSNVLQTVIAAAIIYAGAELGDLTSIVKLHEYRITQIEQGLEK